MPQRTNIDAGHERMITDSFSLVKFTPESTKNEIAPIRPSVEAIDSDDDENYQFSMIDHNWSKKILELVGNKAQLMESFSWLSTVGGGFSSLGERDNKFSMRAATLSLGHQLRLAELLGDERLKVMCHLFAALAALQLDNKQFCRDYITRVIMPMINQLPYRDPILINMLKHIYFRLSTLDRFMLYRNAIANKRFVKNGE